MKRIEMRSPVGSGTIAVPEPQVERYVARGFVAVKPKPVKRAPKPEDD